MHPSTGTAPSPQAGPPASALPTPATAEQATAHLLALALGDPDYGPAQALKQQREQVAALLDPAAPEALSLLARQLGLLEALFLRFSAEALKQGRAEKRALLLRSALLAQGAYARTFALLQGLQVQVQGRGSVAVEEL